MEGERGPSVSCQLALMLLWFLSAGPSGAFHCTDWKRGLCVVVVCVCLYHSCSIDMPSCPAFRPSLSAKTSLRKCSAAA